LDSAISKIENEDHNYLYVYSAHFVLLLYAWFSVKGGSFIVIVDIYYSLIQLLLHVLAYLLSSGCNEVSYLPGLTHLGYSIDLKPSQLSVICL